MQAAAAGCLVNLAANDANQVAITDADAVEPLINLLGGGSAVYLAYLQTAAASALRNLAYKNIHNQVAIAQNGAIEPLVALLSGASPQVQIAAAAALRNLAENNNDNQEFIARANDGEGVNALVEMARGDVIACFDDDNAYAPLYLETMVDHLSSSGDRLVALVARAPTALPVGHVCKVRREGGEPPRARRRPQPPRRRRRVPPVRPAHRAAVGDRRVHGEE